MAKKNTDIETLRAVAIILVLLQHLVVLFEWSPHPLGAIENYLQFWGGVDLFFCISGYVVSKSIIDAIDVAKTEGREWLVVKSFWVRRLYRLLPSAWLWMAVLFIYSRGSLNVLPSCIAIMAGIANFAQYFGIQMGAGLVYWSLALEEQFYLLFPFFVLFVPVAWRYRILLLAIALQFPMFRDMSTIYWGTRLDAMMWGVVIAMFSRTSQYHVFEPRSLNKKHKAWCVSLFLIFMLAAMPAALITVPFHVGLMAIISAALVYAASFNKSYTLPSRILRPALTWIGSRSYAIYLCHLPAYAFTRDFWMWWAKHQGLPPPGGTYTLRSAAMAIALIGIFSELNFRLVETPFRERGVNVARKITSATPVPTT